MSMIRARVVERRDDGSMVVLVEERVFEEFPISVTKCTWAVGNATYGTYRFGKALEPKVAWKVIEAIEEHRKHGDNIKQLSNPERGRTMYQYPCSYLKFKIGEEEVQRRYAPGRHLVPEYMHVRVVNGNAPYHTPKEGGEFRVDVFTWFRGISGRRVAVEFFDDIGQVKKFIMGLKEKHGTKRSRFTIITKDGFNILDG
ncbi:hypothetical protein ES703_108261 [subsurface metagenome]